MSTLETKRQLLLSYVELLADRNAYGLDAIFEYALWDDLQRGKAHTRLVDGDEAEELVWLVIETDSWVTYNMDTGTFQLIDLDAWRLLLQKRGH
jgi:hypothetical protein